MDIYKVMYYDHVRSVRRFMELAGQELPTKPKLPDESVRRLRALLILEEAFETIAALGFYCRRETLSIHGSLGTLDRYDLSDEQKLVEIADGCADISVVTIGTLLACGIAPEPVLDEVDSSNLRKFTGGHKDEETGKWIKPADFKGPDLRSVIDMMK